MFLSVCLLLTIILSYNQVVPKGTTKLDIFIFRYSALVKSRYSCVSSVADIADYNHDGCWGYFCGVCSYVGCPHADG